MKKKDYIKPTLRVVLLKPRCRILTVSNYEVRTVSGGYLRYAGSDDDYDDGAR